MSDIVKYTPQYPVPNIAHLQQVSEMMYASKMFKDIENAAAAFTVMYYGATLGLDEITSLNNIYRVPSGGRVVLQPNYVILLAMIRRHPGYDYRVIENTDTSCTIEFYRVFNGERVLEGISTYTRTDAIQAGVINNPPWKTNPKDMMLAAATRKGVRRYCPDVAIFAGSDSDVEVHIETPEEQAQQHKNQMLAFLESAQDNFGYTVAEVQRILTDRGIDVLDVREVQRYTDILKEEFTRTQQVSESAVA